MEDGLPPAGEEGDDRSRIDAEGRRAFSGILDREAARGAGARVDYAPAAGQGFGGGVNRLANGAKCLADGIDGASVRLLHHPHHLVCVGPVDVGRGGISPLRAQFWVVVHGRIRL